MNDKRRCLVLGGKGFIGSHLVDALLERGHFVRLFDRPSSVPVVGGRTHAVRLEEYEGDFLSEADVAQAVIGCDICFHLVSTTSPKSSNTDPVFDVESNLIGTVRLLNHAVKNGVQKVVFLSSGGTVYGPPVRVPIDEDHPTYPICSYGVTKLAIEKYLGFYYHSHGLDFTVLRLSNPFGERQRAVADQGAVAVFLGKALRNETIDIWGDGSVIRDYFYISDAIAAILAAMDYRGTEKIFNIGSGHGISLNELLTGIERVIDRKVARNYTAGRAFDVPVSILAIERARRALGWSPRVSFLEGVERTVAWMRSSPDVAVQAVTPWRA